MRKDKKDEYIKKSDVDAYIEKKFDEKIEKFFKNKAERIFGVSLEVVNDVIRKNK